MQHRTLVLFTLGLLSFVPIGLPVSAQTVSSDRTTGTVVSGADISGTAPFTITEGSVRSGDTGTALFHSFDTFSPAARAVIFDLRDSQNTIDTQAVATIVGRVTGNTPSFIDGQLSITLDSNTTAPDLFLINPQGVLFGENAQLSLPGSFSVSTAESILFGQEATFSAVEPGAAPLLTTSSPLGLQFGANNSAGISVQGTGHRLATSNPIFSPYIPTGPSSGLSVSPGAQLQLIGESIDISGGALSAPGGRIELGGVREGIVTFTDQGIDYGSVEQFGDIGLAARSLVNVSSPIAGSIQIQGQQLQISDGSLVLNQNQGASTGGEVNIKVAEQLLLTGASPTVDALSSIVTETFGPGDAGAINISAAQLSIEAGATLGSRSFGAGNSGQLQVSARQANVSGHTPNAPNVFSFLGTLGASSGDVGNVKVTLQDLLVADGGYVGSSTLGSGQGGDVTVGADSIQVVGATPAAIPSAIAATTAGRDADSGDLSVKTRELIVRDSGLVTTASVNVGDAGNIDVEAFERIVLSGGLPNLPTSTIASTVDFPPLAYRLLLGLSGTPRGSAGDVTVSTPILEVSDSATLTVANIAEGDAGQLTINADSISLEQSRIDAFTTTGEGGNIELNISDILLMQDLSAVNATAGSTGNGGNITINSPVIVGLENSDIIASAIAGSGGNISITTQGLFGLVAREQQTPQNDITASSQFGLSGTVSVEGFKSDLDSGLVRLPVEVVDSSDQIASSCADMTGNRFVVSGRGGLPLAPSRQSIDRTWNDLRDLSALGDQTLEPASEMVSQSLNRRHIEGRHVEGRHVEDSVITEAATWTTDQQGRIKLVADTGSIAPAAHLATCASSFASTDSESINQANQAVTPAPSAMAFKKLTKTSVQDKSLQNSQGGSFIG